MFYYRCCNPLLIKAIKLFITDFSEVVKFMQISNFYKFEFFIVNRPIYLSTNQKAPKRRYLLTNQRVPTLSFNQSGSSDAIFHAIRKYDKWTNNISPRAIL